MTRGALLFLAACLGVTARAAADDLDQVMQVLATRQHGQVSFIEQHFLSLLKRPVESSGELIYDAPNRLEKRTLEPHPESLVLLDTVLTVHRGHGTRVLDLKSYPEVAPFIDSIRATLAGDRAALQKTFQVDFSGDLARWTLLLAPRDAAVAATVARIQIDGLRDNLFRVEIKQVDGDRSLMTLRARP